MSTNSINENSLPQWERALDCAEETMRRISGQCRLQRTGHPDVFCSTLPTHWRSNKSLPTPFVVLAFFPIQDGTKVCISAGNDENYCADVKNNMAEFNGQLARFSDLRFVGKSGRGKNFNLSITIFTQPHSQLIIVPNVVKVTVDGPRDSRNASKYLNGQYIPIPKRIRPGSGLDHLPNQNGTSRKNCIENRRCISNSNSNKINHPITGAPASNFLLSPNLPSANILPPTFLPQTLPMAATLGGLFPRLMNGQLACKIGSPLPVNLPTNIQQNIRMFGIGGFGHNLRMPSLINSSHSNADSIMTQIASARLFGQSAGLIPPINSFPHQIGQSRFASPILNENLQAAISAAVASASSNVPPTLPNQSSIFPSPILPNPVNILAVQAMAAGLFGNGQMNADKFGINTNGIVERNENGEQNGRNGELNSKANCEEATATGSSPDEGHCSGEWRGEEEEEGDNNGIIQNCNPPINNRKRRSRSEEVGIDGREERRKLPKYEEEENGRRLAKSGDGNRENNKMEEEIKPWRLALKDERREDQNEAHSAAALWRPFQPC